ncbi:MAG: 30S ribosomal protein S20 [Deltaproteobacteria bacterium]|nr:30S ribosomal protein S20 [Deltaproteobacteria bacterium]
MANHKSALKRARQSVTRNARNGINKTKVKNALKKARLSVGEAPEVTNEAFRKAMSALHKASSKGTIHAKNAARRISRLAKLCHQASTGQQS